MLGPWAVFGDSGGDSRIIVDNFSTPPAGTFGTVSFVNISGGSDCLGALVLGRGSYIGTGDFYMRTVLRIVDKAKIGVVHTNTALAALTSPGLFVGLTDAGTSSVGIVAGNDEANWQVLFGGSLHDVGSDGAITNNTFYKLELERIAGTITMSVNGTVVYTASTGLSYVKAVPTIMVTGLDTLGALGEAVTVDEFRLSFPRT
jgi:hypothetical protein